MEKLSVPQLSCVARDTSLHEISSGLNGVKRHAIGQAPWNASAYKPEVSFSIAYTSDAVLVKYFVQENFIRVVHHTDNSPVHEDSCVEFFIAFDNDEAYYNLEFNCIGTCLFGYGKDRSDRKLIGNELTCRIRRAAVIQSTAAEKNNSVSWELTLVIPLEVFAYHRISSLQDRQCRVNFYKCGDKLPEPHFLAWKDVIADSPDFHLPQFFGSMQFV